jgi:trk system potassium uptake protein TrkH
VARRRTRPPRRTPAQSDAPAGAPRQILSVRRRLLWIPRDDRSLLGVAWDRLTPPQLLVLSFGALTLAGTLYLRFMPGLTVGRALSWTDAAFMATSAVCVTGLVVVDPATQFTFAGQLSLLVMFQLGGLGLLTLTSLVLLNVGQRLSFRHQVLARTAGASEEIDLRHLLRSVIRFTFFLEGTGAVLLYLAFVPDMGWVGAAWPAVFHAVSAFCNAGFSVFPTSLAQHAFSWIGLVTVMSLIVLGGLGFITLEELHVRFARGGRRIRMSLHSRLVLTTSIILVLGGWIGFGLFEWNNTLDLMGGDVKILNSMFGAITPRTAGFNTVDYSQVTEPTAFMTILLMMIGGAPGSTAGGLKVTTVALLVGLAIARLRGDEELNAWGRTVPAETVQRAVGIGVIGFTVMALAIFALVAIEEPFISHTESSGGFLRYMFEVVSAFGTVGLSMGVTPSLSDPGRWLIIVLMFVGRLGLTTFAAAVAFPRSGARDVRFAHEDVAVG